MIASIAAMVGAYFGSYFFVKFLVSESPRVINFFLVIFGYLFGILIGCVASFGASFLMCETILSECDHGSVIIGSITWGIGVGILFAGWGIRKGWKNAKYGESRHRGGIFW